MYNAYIYNPDSKEELWAEVSYDFSDANEPAVENIVYTTIEIKQRSAIGTLLCSAISADFDSIVESLESNRAELLPKEIGHALELFDYLDHREEASYFVNTLYFVKEYIDICVEYPAFFSHDYFDAFIRFTASADYLPDLHGAVETNELSQDNITICEDANLFGPDFDSTKIDWETLDYRQNAGLIREYMLSFVPESDDFEGKAIIYGIHGGLTTAILASVATLIEEKMIVKKCQNCGKYFVPLRRSDALYCDRTSPQDPSRTCKEYGSQKLWYDRIKANDVAKLARNVYSAKQMLVRRNPDIVEYKRMFDYFKAKRKKWEKMLESGEKTCEEYVAWLNQMKAKKTL